MASICVHRAQQTPPDSAPRHTRSRGDLQEDHRPATHGRADPASPFPAIHLTRQSPFYGPAGHIRSRGGIDLCPSSVANPSRQRSRAYRLARCFAGSSPNCHTQPSDLDCSLVPRFPAIHLARQSAFQGPPGHINSRDGIDLCPSSAANPSRQHSRAHRLARCFAGRSQTCHGPATQGPQSLVSAQTLTFLQFI